MTLDEEISALLADPLRARTPLPLSGRFHALGFPLRIRTNSRAALEAASESWGWYGREFEREPVEIHVTAQEGTGEEVPDPAYRMQGDWMMIVSDRENFALCDFAARRGHCYVSTAMLARHGWFRWFFLEAMVYTLLAQDDVATVHAACVAWNGRGVLLCGGSGAGKSTLAYACARAGWTYVGDDATLLPQRSAGREAIGKPHHLRFRPEAAQLFPELAVFPECTHPNGKPTVEVPASAFPGIRTASRCEIETIVLLDRRSGGEAEAQAVPLEEARAAIESELPLYSEAVQARHREAVARLLAAPAFRLRYANFFEAIELLKSLVSDHGSNR